VISWADLPHAHAVNAKQIRDATAVKPQKAVIVVGLSVVQGMNGRQIPPMEEMPYNNTVVPAGPSRAGPPDCGRAGRTSRMEFEEAAEALSLPASNNNTNAAPGRFISIVACTGPVPALCSFTRYHAGGSGGDSDPGLLFYNGNSRVIV
jgi:hypothetical protein